jgi:hypothetical protein
MTIGPMAASNARRKSGRLGTGTTFDDVLVLGSLAEAFVGSLPDLVGSPPEHLLLQLVQGLFRVTAGDRLFRATAGPAFCVHARA